MSQPIRVGAIGATIELTVVDQDGAVLDISTATLTNSLFLKSPRNKLVRATPSFVTDGSDGKIAYDTVSGELSEAGAWGVQFKLVMGADVLPSEIIPMQVQANLFP